MGTDLVRNTEEKATVQTYDISASNETLLRQASMTANEYFDKAIEGIDARFGKGFAKAHPELIAAHMQAAAIDLGAAVIARAIETGVGSLSEIVEAIDRNVEAIDRNVAAVSTHA
jgi:hypothetical protein